MYGEILISGHNSRISLTKVTPGDVATINTFIKTFFLTGGSLKGRRMTSQQIMSHLMSNLPGSFSVTA